MPQSKVLSDKNTLFFYQAKGPHGFLSNLYYAPIIFQERTFPTSEHAYQFGKFKDKAVAEWAMKAPKAHLVAIIGHGLLSWDIVKNWSKKKVPRMKAVLHAKFSQHPDLCQKLIQTYPKILIEESNTDSFWGIGKNRRGKNTLGKLLMIVRKEKMNIIGSVK